MSTPTASPDTVLAQLIDLGGRTAVVTGTAMGIRQMIAHGQCGKIVNTRRLTPCTRR